MRAVIISAIVGGMISYSSVSVRAADNANLQFVTEYVRELGELERLRAAAFDELNADADTSNKMASCVRSSTRFELELRAQVSML
jgi:hypothetical protein